MADIGGQWSGVYNYPPGHDAPAIAFDAALAQQGGRFTGTIEEDDVLFGGGRLTAVVDGTLDGRRVEFVKFYDSGAEEYDTVRYAGALSEDGLEIAGRWAIPNDGSGTFIMVRAEAPPEPAAVEAEETMGAGLTPPGTA